MSENNELLDLNIDGLMEEYRMLSDSKTSMHQLYTQTLNRIQEHEGSIGGPRTTRGTGARVNHKYVADQTSNLTSIMKTIMDCIKEMNSIKKTVIELRIKEHNLNNKVEDSESHNILMKGIMEAISRSSIDQIKDTVNTDDYYEEKSSEDLMAEVVAKMDLSNEDQKKEDIQNDINNLKSDEMNLKNLLAIYFNEIDVVFAKEEEYDDYEWVVIDNTNLMYEREEVKEQYPELYSHLKDLFAVKVYPEEGYVLDADNNRFEILEFE